MPRLTHLPSDLLYGSTRALRTRVLFYSQTWLLCHGGEYKSVFEFGEMVALKHKAAYLVQLPTAVVQQQVQGGPGQTPRAVCRALPRMVRVCL